MPWIGIGTEETDFPKHDAKRVAPGPISSQLHYPLGIAGIDDTADGIARNLHTSLPGTSWVSAACLLTLGHTLGDRRWQVFFPTYVFFAKV